MNSTPNYPTKPENALIVAIAGQRCSEWYDILPSRSLTIVCTEQDEPALIEWLNWNNFQVTNRKVSDSEDALYPVAIRASEKPRERKQVRLIGKYGSGACPTCLDMHDTIYMEDGECVCGVHKHHWHCPECGCIQQVG